MDEPEDQQAPREVREVREPDGEPTPTSTAAVLGPARPAGPGAPRTPQALDDFYRWLLWAVPQVNKFPRDHRFTLGDRIIGWGYDVLELLVQASYAPAAKQAALVARANERLDVLRLLLRLAADLGVLSPRRYEHGTRGLVSIGKQLGGWKKSAVAGRPAGSPGRPRGGRTGRKESVASRRPEGERTRGAPEQPSLLEFGGQADDVSTSSAARPT